MLLNLFVCISKTCWASACQPVPALHPGLQDGTLSLQRGPPGVAREAHSPRGPPPRPVPPPVRGAQDDFRHLPRGAGWGGSLAGACQGRTASFVSRVSSGGCGAEIAVLGPEPSLPEPEPVRAGPAVSPQTLWEGPGSAFHETLALVR